MEVIDALLSRESEGAVFTCAQTINATFSSSAPNTYLHK